MSYTSISVKKDVMRVIDGIVELAHDSTGLIRYNNRAHFVREALKQLIHKEREWVT